VKTTESRGVCGDDPAKKIKGRKRPIVTDTLGLLVGAVVHAVTIQAATARRRGSTRSAPDGRGCATCSLAAATPATSCKPRAPTRGAGRWRSSGAPTRPKGFEGLPRRGVVERTFAWLGRCRRLARDWEKSIASATAFLLLAHIRLLTRRIARLCHA
jgi:transposase